MKTVAHNLASIALAAPTGLIAHYYTSDGTVALCVFAGCISGVWFSPDLDLGENRKAKVKNFLWVWFWWPYAKVIKHRSFWSHAPIVGTLVRMVYFWGIIGALAWMLDWWAAFVALPYHLIAWWCIGLVVADTAHWMMDTIGSK